MLLLSSLNYQIVSINRTSPALLYCIEGHSFSILLEESPPAEIGFFLEGSAANRNGRWLFIFDCADVGCRGRIRGQTLTNLQEVRYRCSWITTKVIFQTDWKQVIQVNKWTYYSNKQWNWPVSHGFRRNHFPVDTHVSVSWQAKVRQNKFLPYPWESHKWMTAKKPAGEKTPVIPTHEGKVLQLFVCSSIRRLGYKKSNITVHLVTTGLAKNWCRQ